MSAIQDGLGDEELVHPARTRGLREQMAMTHPAGSTDTMRHGYRFLRSADRPF
jgi:hypothetical protein